MALRTAIEAEAISISELLLDRFQEAVSMSTDKLLDEGVPTKAGFGIRVGDFVVRAYVIVEEDI